jgi:hypothetical protein
MITIGNTLRPTSATPKPPPARKVHNTPAITEITPVAAQISAKLISDIDTGSEGCLLVVGNCS